MRNTFAKLSLAAAAMLIPATAHAAILVLSTSNSTAPTDNPAAVTLNRGASATYYIWARSTSATGTVYVSGLDLQIAGSGEGLTVSDISITPGVFSNASTTHAAAALTGSGLTYTSTNGVKVNTASSTGIFNDAFKVVGSFTVTAPANATYSAASSLFIYNAAGSAVTESASSGVRHFYGFGGTATSITNVAGLDGTEVSGAGVLSATNTGITYNRGAGYRSSIADATVKIQDAPVPTGPSISITAGGTNPVTVTGSTAAGYVAATDTVAPYVFNFSTTNTGKVIVGLDFDGAVPSDIGTITGATVLASNPGFASNFDVFLDLGSGTAFGTSAFTIALSNVGGTLAGIAVIPEPSALGLLGLAALPMLRRRRA